MPETRRLYLTLWLTISVTQYTQIGGVVLSEHISSNICQRIFFNVDGSLTLVFPTRLEKPGQMQCSSPQRLTFPPPIVVYPPLPSSLTPLCHPLVKTLTRQVNDWISSSGHFKSEKEKKRYVGHETARVACLLYPRALDDRLIYACKLITVLFLLDGRHLRSAGANINHLLGAYCTLDVLESFSIEDGTVYTERLISIIHGDTEPKLCVPIEFMFDELWTEMRSCDAKLADIVIGPLVVVLRAMTARERLHIKTLDKYLLFRKQDIGQEYVSIDVCYHFHALYASTRYQTYDDLALWPP